MPIDIANEEFVCFRFIHTVFEVMALCERVTLDLANPSREITTDYIVRLQFGKLRNRLRIMLNDPTMVEAFQRRYPSRADLLDLASQQDAAMERLHSVRLALLEPHLTVDRTDVQNFRADIIDHPADLTKADIARANGLTVSQFDDLVSQVDRTGFLHLSDVERSTLSTAIKAEFTGL